MFFKNLEYFVDIFGKKVSFGVICNQITYSVNILEKDLFIILRPTFEGTLCLNGLTLVCSKHPFV